VVHKKWNIHALDESSDLTVLVTVRHDHCSEWWSCWTLCSIVLETWLPCTAMIISETVRLFDPCLACYVQLFNVPPATCIDPHSTLYFLRLML